MKQGLLAALLAFFMGVAFAQGAAQGTADNRKGGADEQTIRTKFEQSFGVKPDSVSRTPWGWWEIVVSKEIVYVDATGDYLFDGIVVNARNRENLTQNRRDELLKVDYAKLPLDQAVRLRFGNGSRQFVTFEDPNCPYCRKLHTDLKGLKDATVYVFLYPILSADSMEKAKGIWCAKDRAAAWNDLMLNGKAPPAAPENCKHPIDRTLALGRDLGISGTPTIIFQDGSRLPGAVGIERIEDKLAGGRAGKK